jgi:hypothetical protein
MSVPAIWAAGRRKEARRLSSLVPRFEDSSPSRLRISHDLIKKQTSYLI